MRRLACLVFALLVVIGVGCRRSQPPAQSVPVPEVADTSTVPAVDLAPAAADLVADLPEYPGATRQAFSTKADVEHGWAKTTEVKATSTDGYQVVFDFYQKAIAEKGWTVVGMESKPGKAEWKLSKGTSVGEVKIDQEAGAVEVKLERKDR